MLLGFGGSVTSQQWGESNNRPPINVILTVMPWREAADAESAARLVVGDVLSQQIFYLVILCWMNGRFCRGIKQLCRRGVQNAVLNCFGNLRGTDVISMREADVRMDLSREGAAHRREMPKRYFVRFGNSPSRNL